MIIDHSKNDTRLDTYVFIQILGKSNIKHTDMNKFGIYYRYISME